MVLEGGRAYNLAFISCHGTQELHIFFFYYQEPGSRKSTSSSAAW